MHCLFCCLRLHLLPCAMPSGDKYRQLKPPGVLTHASEHPILSSVIHSSISAHVNEIINPCYTMGIQLFNMHFLQYRIVLISISLVKDNIFNDTLACFAVSAKTISLWTRTMKGPFSVHTINFTTSII